MLIPSCTHRSRNIVGHVHDELIIETPMDANLDAICEQMGRTPDWIEGLCLRADGYETPVNGIIKPADFGS